MDKLTFKQALKEFVIELNQYIATDDGQWSIKGFIDIYKNIYTISTDSKIISKILEIHLFPKIDEFAKKKGFSIVLADKQNYYPDMSFVYNKNKNIIYAVDIKTTYRNPKNPEYCNGFTLGSVGTYFKDRDSKKNIQFPYSKYSGHFCLGIIYSRIDSKKIDETEIIRVNEISSKTEKQNIGAREVTTVEELQLIESVIQDFQFFVCEKWEIASDQKGSFNTNNIGSITYIEDIINGNGVFKNLGEEIFDEYWMNYNTATLKKGNKSIKINKLSDFLEFKNMDKSLAFPKKRKKVKNEKDNSTTIKESGNKN